MKKSVSIAFVFSFIILLAGCGESPMTEVDMAAKYGMSIEEYQEQKEAAARMNMSIEDHLKHGAMEGGH